VPPARRIVAVTPVDHPGGAEIHLLRLLTALAQRDWQVTLTSPGEGEMKRAALEAGYGWRALSLGGLARRSGARAIASWPSARGLSDAADVMYLNGGVCGRLLPALRSGRARRVLHIHDMVDRVPRIWRRADIVLADSLAVAGRLNGLSPHVVYGPVDPDPPPATPPWASGPGPIIGFVGRIEPRKGPLDLVRAAPLIRQRLPEARIVIVGDDPYHSDPAYTRAVVSSPEIEHYPWTDNAPGLMRHLDVLVLPSHQEPLGTVLAEAMAVGTPVVASAVDGLPEVVRDGITGRLVAPGDPQALTSAVIEVLSRRPDMAESARLHARTFAAESYADQVERLITG
jgi:glycosyltransferase involved in cell wall biosynthesis